MKPVVQEEITGCGIAAVAAVAGVTYREAKRAANSLGIYADDKLLWSETSHVRKLLMHFHLRASRRQIPFRSWKSLPNVALMAMKWHEENKKPFWHWTVFVREGTQAYILDPNKALQNPKRTDFNRMKPKWFIAISK